MTARLILATLLLVSSGLSQQTLRVDVNLVDVTATVTDHQGRYISNLGIQDFIVEEDGIRQTITHFSNTRHTPISLAVLVDTSASMERHLKIVVPAVQRFIEKSPKRDEMVLLSFAGKPTVLHEFSTNKKQVSRALRAVLARKNSFDIFEIISSIRDSLVFTVMKMRESKFERKAIVMITDGQDTSSQTTVDEITSLIGRSEVVVYSVGIGGDPIDPQRDSLQLFSNQTGGRTVPLPVNKLAELDDVLTDVAYEFQHQYSLAYYSSQTDDNSFHRISVRTTRPSVVRTRTGYRARQADQ